MAGVSLRNKRQICRLMWASPPPGLFNAQFMKRIARSAPMPPKAMRCLASVTL